MTSALCSTLETCLRRATVIPVIVIDDVQRAVALGRALIAGGLPVIEVTLRTSAGFAAIERLVGDVDGATIAAGTVTSADEIARLARIGVHFCVSPGLTSTLVAAARDHNMPLLPGVQTTSELMAGREQGLRHFKFFPAAQAGGPPMLAAWQGPFPDALFCPTGGVTPENAREYLSLANVVAVGSSWVAPRDLIVAGRWTTITARARSASAWI